MNEESEQYWSIIKDFTDICDDNGIRKVVNDLPEHLYEGLRYYFFKEDIMRGEQIPALLK